MKAHLLNNVGDVGAREGEVLETPARLRYSVGSATGAPAVAANFGEVSTGVVADLQPVMPALSKISAADRKSTRLNSSHRSLSRMPSSA